MTKNYVEIIGYAGQDPQRIGNSKAPVKLSLATTERWKDKSGGKQERTEWHTVYFWDRTAEVALGYIRKGSHILVSGSLRSRQYESESGKHTVWQIHARELLLLDPRTAQPEEESDQTGPTRAEGTA